jgi:WD40 repeat protein
MIDERLEVIRVAHRPGRTACLAWLGPDLVLTDAKAIELWDLQDQATQTIVTHTHPVGSLDLSHLVDIQCRGDSGFSMDTEGRILKWNRAGEILIEYRVPGPTRNRNWSLSFDVDQEGQFALAGSQGGNLYLFQGTHSKPVYCYETLRHRSPVLSCCFGADMR